YMVASIFSSVNKVNFTPTLRSVLDSDRPPTTAVMDRLVKMASAYGDDQGIAGLLEAIARPHLGAYTTTQMTAMGTFLDALHERNETLGDLSQRPPLRDAVKTTAGLFAAARKMLVDPAAPMEQKLLAVRL